MGESSQCNKSLYDLCKIPMLSIDDTTDFAEYDETKRKFNETIAKNESLRSILASSPEVEYDEEEEKKRELEKEEQERAAWDEKYYKIPMLSMDDTDADPEYDEKRRKYKEMKRKNKGLYPPSSDDDETDEEEQKPTPAKPSEEKKPDIVIPPEKIKEFELFKEFLKEQEEEIRILAYGERSGLEKDEFYAEDLKKENRNVDTHCEELKEALNDAGGFLTASQAFKIERVHSTAFTQKKSEEEIKISAFMSNEATEEELNCSINLLSQTLDTSKNAALLMNEVIAASEHAQSLDDDGNDNEDKIYRKKNKESKLKSKHFPPINESTQFLEEQLFMYINEDETAKENESNAAKEEKEPLPSTSKCTPRRSMRLRNTNKNEENKQNDFDIDLDLPNHNSPEDGKVDTEQSAENDPMCLENPQLSLLKKQNSNQSDCNDSITNEELVALCEEAEREDEKRRSMIEQNTTNTSATSGFSFASGKNVKVNQSKLDVFKSMLDDEKSAANSSSYNLRNSKNQGFAFASGTKTAANQNCIEKYKKLLDEEIVTSVDDNCDYILNKADNSDDDQEVVQKVPSANMAGLSTVKPVSTDEMLYEFCVQAEIEDEKRLSQIKSAQSKSLEDEDVEAKHKKITESKFHDELNDNTQFLEDQLFNYIEKDEIKENKSIPSSSKCGPRRSMRLRNVNQKEDNLKHQCGDNLELTKCDNASDFNDSITNEELVALCEEAEREEEKRRSMMEVNKTNTSAASGFSFGSGKNIKVNQSKIDTFKSMFEDEKSASNSSNYNLRSANSKNPEKSLSFTSGTKAPVNQRSIEKYKKLLDQEVVTSVDDNCDYLLNPTPVISSDVKAIENQGFSFVSGKKAAIKKSLVSEYKTILENEVVKNVLPGNPSTLKSVSTDEMLYTACVQAEQEDERQKSQEKQSASKSNEPVIDFSFASGKILKIDQSKIENFKKILDSQDSLPAPVNPKSLSSKTQGFSFCSGVKAAVNQKSVEKYSKLLDEKFVKADALPIKKKTNTEFDFDDIPKNQKVADKYKKLLEYDPTLDTNEADEYLFANKQSDSVVQNVSVQSSTPVVTDKENSGFSFVSGKKAHVSDLKISNFKRKLEENEETHVSATPKSSKLFQKRKSLKNLEENEQVEEREKDKMLKLDNGTPIVKNALPAQITSTPATKNVCDSPMPSRIAKSLFAPSHTSTPLGTRGYARISGLRAKPANNSLKLDQPEENTSHANISNVPISPLVTSTPIAKNTHATTPNVAKTNAFKRASPVSDLRRGDAKRVRLSGKTKKKPNASKYDESVFDTTGKTVILPYKPEHLLNTYIKDKRKVAVFKPDVIYVTSPNLTASQDEYVNWCGAEVRRARNYYDPNEDHELTNTQIVTYNDICDKAEIQYERENEWKAQSDYVKSKPESDTRPMTGTLMMMKCGSNRKKLGDLLEAKPMKFKQPRFRNLQCVAFEHILLHMFDMENFCENAEQKIFVTVGDNAKLIFDPKNPDKVGFKEIRQCFLASLGVDPKLVSDAWIENAYKMIFAKFMWCENYLDKLEKDSMLSPENILLSLKYRYDREIDRHQRPALRKILERDEAHTRRIVLRVEKIHYSNHDGFSLDVSDGWHRVKASIDSCLAEVISTGKIVPFSKIMTCNMEVSGLRDGHDILNLPSEVRLMLHGNSTRLVSWDTKLGFTKNPQPFIIPLDSIKHDGKTIPRVQVVVTQVYSKIFVESENGKKVFRSEKMQNRIENEKEKVLSGQYRRIRSKVNSEFKSMINQRYAKIKENFTKMPTLRLEDICDVFEYDTECPLAIKMKSQLSNRDLERINEIYLKRRSDLNEKVKTLMKEYEDKSVTQLLKFRVVDANRPKNAYLVSWWHPTEDIIDFIKQGRAIDLIGSSAANVLGVTCINAGHESILRPMKKKPDMQKFEKYFRKITKFEEIDSTFSPLHDEFDFACVVIYIREKEKKSKTQEVFVADENMNFVSVNFYIDIAEYAYDDVLQEGKSLFIRNLEWRKSFRDCNSKLPEAFAIQDSTVFVINTRKQNEIDRLKELQDSVNAQSDYFKECQAKLETLLGEKIKVKESTTAQIAPIISPSFIYSAKRNNVQIPRHYRFQ